MKFTHTSLKYAQIIVWLHTAIAVVHGISHVANSAELPLFANVFVIVVIVLAPLLALLLLCTHWRRSGALLLTLSMLASLVFGIWNHFLVPGPDNVAQVMSGMWSSSFLITSILVALSEAVGTGIGIWCMYVLSQPHVLPKKGDDKSFGGSGRKFHA